MKVCMPVKSDLGIDSLVYGHFGKAPCYVVFDSETREITTIVNVEKQHEHGDCNPLMSFQDFTPDIVVVGGIGGGALGKLNSAGVRVFKAEGDTVKDNLESLTSKGLPEFSVSHTCSGHHKQHEDSDNSQEHEHSHGDSGCCHGDDHGHEKSQEGGGCCH